MKRSMDFSKSSRSVNRNTNLSYSNNKLNNESTMMQTPQKSKNSKLNTSINNISSLKKGSAKTDDIFNMRQSFQMSGVNDRLVQSELFKVGSGSIAPRKKTKDQKLLSKLMN